MNSGIIDEWIEFAMDAASDDYKNSNDTRAASLTLLNKLWVTFPEKFEEAEDKSNAVIALFNKVVSPSESTHRRASVLTSFLILSRLAVRNRTL